MDSGPALRASRNDNERKKLRRTHLSPCRGKIRGAKNRAQTVVADGQGDRSGAIIASAPPSLPMTRSGAPAFLRMGLNGCTMPVLSHRIERLDEELLALGEEAMIIEEFDGFVAGLLVCPETISPNEWLPFVWNRDSGETQSAFDDIDRANRVIALIMEHYNDVVLTLMKRPKRYRPLFPIDRNEILWEIWIEGFAQAVGLRPESWEKLLEADPDTVEAMVGMLMLIDVASGSDEIARDAADDLVEGAPNLIPGWVVTLNAWRIANTPPRSGPDLHQASTPMPVSKTKVGRNALCPCGSGKKYKRCCALN
jgi:uncharacterized protein